MVLKAVLFLVKYSGLFALVRQLTNRDAGVILALLGRCSPLVKFSGE